MRFSLFLLTAFASLAGLAATSFGNHVITPRSDPKLSVDDEVQYERALCGPPENPMDLLPAKDYARLRPPIQSQDPANWCGIFGASDLLNDYLHSSSREPYTDQNRVSLVDLAAKTRESAHSHILKFNWGIFPFDALVAVQDHGNEVRPLAAFDLNGNDRFTKELVDALFANEKAAHDQISKETDPCLEAAVFDTEFLDNIKDFVEISGHLGSLLRAKPLARQGVIFDYERQAQQLDQRSKIKPLKLPPFVANYFQTSDRGDYFSRLGAVLSSNTPVSVILCAADIDPTDPDLDLPAGDHCGVHTLTAVRAGWENGQCRIRLRNSWGADWGNGHPPDGMIDLTVSQLEKSVQDYSDANSAKLKSAAYVLNWISHDGSKNYQNVIMDSADDSGNLTSDTFSGRVHISLDGNMKDWDGTNSSQAGIQQYKNGKWVSAKNYVEGDGIRYTGTFDSKGGYARGVETYSDGSLVIYGGEKPVAKNWVDSSMPKGARFDGTLDKKWRHLTGVMTLANGKKVYFKNGKALRSK